MKYDEILKLKEMLEKANIPFEFTDDMYEAKKNGDIANPLYKKLYPAYQIIIYKHNRRICDAVQHCYSYGNERNLIEIFGAITNEERKEEGCEVLGYLTAEEVFKRFKHCYERGTSTYWENNDEDINS